MNQEQFVACHAAEWRRLEGWVARGKKPKKNTAPLEKASVEEFASLYRKSCQHLALARSRLYSHHLINRLNNLVLSSHAQLYSAKRNIVREMALYIFSGFPQRVRGEWRSVLISAALFYISLLGMMLAIIVNPDMVYTVMDNSQLREFEYMYDPTHADTLGRTPDREASSDVMMFGYYVSNNTGIGFVPLPAVCFWASAPSLLYCSMAFI